MLERKKKIERGTKETKISVEIHLDGTGKYDIKCDNSFLKHMMETLARYSSTDITINSTGNDEHHLIEDVAITLGIAFKEALGKNNPIERMATGTIVMDDAMVTVSLDIERPYTDIDCPDPMYLHFLRSFALTAGITLHILVIRGFDNHHIVEASFKALGTCLKEAVKRRETELSTKDKVLIKSN